MSASDDLPVGDPRDPRGDPERQAQAHRPRRRRLLRWPLIVLAVLSASALINDHELLLADPRMTLEALGFAALIVVPIAAVVLWADRRWPPGRHRGD